jgi:hypothetical protein
VSETATVVTKRWPQDFFSPDGALTLEPGEVCDAPGLIAGTFERTHGDGWTIRGEVKEDWYCWVNDFEASHPQFGRVWGNFESEVHADSEEAFADFYAKHPPRAWDYGDI